MSTFVAECADGQVWDCDWDKFVEAYLDQPPPPACTSGIEFDGNQVPLWQHLFIRGAEKLYNVQLHYLNETQISTLQEYFHGLGVHVSYEIHHLTDHEGRLVNNYHFKFGPYWGHIPQTPLRS